MSYYNRALEPLILQALADMPAVFINGPRQAGKSTLSKGIAEEKGYHYLTFDDATVHAAATHNPQAFIEKLSLPVVIDEVQMVPGVFRPLKRLIDDARYTHHQHAQDQHTQGQFLLTGSANIMALPELSDALVGRMSILTLYPLSMREIRCKNGTPIEALFKPQFHLPTHTFTPLNLPDILTHATYPQIASQKHINISQWFESYLTTLMQRDVRQLSEIEKLGQLPLLLQLMATRAGSLLNDTMLARDCGLNLMTYRRYRTLLQHLFLLITLPPWYRNITKRLVKSPKVYFIDTALLCFLSGVSFHTLTSREAYLASQTGHILENFAATEFIKQLALFHQGTLYHFRTQDGKEIDFIIERRDRKLIAIEIKSKTSVTSKDFSVMEFLKKELKEDFIRGIVFYTGTECIPFGHDLFALPISFLWEY